MATRKTSATQKANKASSLKAATKRRKGHPQTNPKSLANLVPHRFTPGTSGNPGGRPKILSAAYLEVLAELDQTQTVTNAKAIAVALSDKAKAGDVGAAKELRSATEGERIRTWRDEIIDALRDELITPEQVTNALGDELAGEIFIAAGLRRNANGETAGGRAGTTPGGAAK